ncbi:MAG: hypothetical protein IPP68_08840 [Elusimicrobia bacterium]|nr:hypothetical protein [Elusimicrobiota bacterium]
MASARNPFDPMEKAFHALGDRFLARTEHLHGDWTLVKEYPLSRDLLAMSQVWTSPDQRRFVIAAKGAPEAVADLCHFPPERLEALRRRVDEHARKDTASWGGQILLHGRCPAGPPARFRF